ncbi:MAG: tRNA-guanine transglycosylase [Thermofilum sp. ex4484_79]|nr:MAG: tRNA-guanine transglycosylase [Thermofilum sp. ex4484_79]
MERDNFEIIEKDLLGRVGILYTSHGKIETPTLAPVVNIAKTSLSPSEIVSLGYPLLMTNSYLIKKNYNEIAIETGVHKLLGVETPVMTDSGAYQLMVYGSVNVSPEEILEYQIKIGSDIGVILDIPTRYDTPYNTVKKEVEETIRRAKKAAEINRDKMLLVGPVQGGQFLNLVAYSATEISKLNFDIYAVGGPTQIMENYKFVDLVRLVMTAKMNLPIGSPLHLFGAGHPFLIPLIVAMGVDIFDSSSYVLYARDLRYMTSYGTLRFNEMRELPCNCPVCSKWSYKDLKDLPKQELVRYISLHNLYVLLEEIRRTKEAIHEGRLWELVEMKAKSHPALQSALAELRKYIYFIEKHHPDTRGILSGLFFFDSMSRYRPNVFRHLKRIKEKYIPPSKKTLLLVEESAHKPFTRESWIAKLCNEIYRRERLSNEVHIAILSSAYSIIPIELDGFYPLSQYESSTILIENSSEEIAADVIWYVANNDKIYSRVVIIYNLLPKKIIEKIWCGLQERGKKVYLLRVDYNYENINDVLRYLESIVD